MNTRDLEAFIVVVETGSVISASARLHLTQPGITRRIQSLERHIGVELLERSSKPLKPTKAGHRVYELGRKVLRAVDDLHSEFLESRDFCGDFRVGVSPFVAETVLAGPLDALRAAFPAMQLHLSSAWSPALIEMVLGNQIDAATVFLPAHEKFPVQISAEEICKQDIVIVAGPDSPFSGRVSLDRLNGTPWVLNQEGCGFRRLVHRAHENAGMSLNVAVEAVTKDLQLSLVARGVGIGVVPLRILDKSGWRDKVKVLHVPELKLDFCVWLIHCPPAGRLAAPIKRYHEVMVQTYEN